MNWQCLQWTVPSERQGTGPPGEKKHSRLLSVRTETVIATQIPSRSVVPVFMSLLTAAAESMPSLMSCQHPETQEYAEKGNCHTGC